MAWTDQVDTDHGATIVRIVFGAQQDQVVAALGSDSRTPDQSIIAKVLPMPAPIVMAFLAEQVAGRSGGTQSGASEGNGSGGRGSSAGGLGSVLGGLLGGGKR